jgi:glycerophosphoryl diester phosphodiesterase
MRLIASVMAALCFVQHAAASDRTAMDAVNENRVLVIAHRGDSKAAPENTLPAFESAVKVGVDFIELDYHHSADGVPVVLHDATLDRTTTAVKLWGGEKIPVASRTAAELTGLDAGAWFGPKFAGTKLPTLDESLDTILAGGFCMVERKAGDAATLVKMLREKKALDRVVVQAFDWKFIADCHRIEPKLVLGGLGSKEFSAEKLDEIAKAGARIVGWKGEDLREADVAAIHTRGLRVWTFTIDDPALAQKLLSWGVDGLISNVPAKIKEVVAHHARPGK